MSSNIKLAVDLVTFFHPQFWGVDTHQSIFEFAEKKPDLFWAKMLDTVAAAGLTGIEPTFSPFNWQHALKTFGSVDGFSKAMGERGLTLASGFFADLEHGSDISDPAVRAKVFDLAKRYAEVIKACGGDAMVVGLPMRRTRDADNPLFVDMAYAQRMGEVLNELGAMTLREGVRLALHTEAHSVFCTGRDVDLFMLATDPLYVGFCPDAAHLLGSGADPVAVTTRHIERLVVAHWKDATGVMPFDIPIDAGIHESHQEFFCRLGAGRVDWPAWARMYRDHNISGWAILELDAAADPLSEMIASRQFVETALLPIIG